MLNTTKLEVGIETNNIYCCCLVTTSPSAMVHLILMLKNGAGGMSAHACGCRPLMWVLVEKDIVHHHLDGNANMAPSSGVKKWRGRG